MNGVFDTRAGTVYDDELPSRYPVPNRYLPAALACIGDWIVYREARRNGGRSGYVAVARVKAIEPDNAMLGHSDARMEGYLDLDHVVPLDGPAAPYEARLRDIAEPSRRGIALQGRSVRTLSAEDFAAIIRTGLEETLDAGNARRLELDAMHTDPATKELTEATPAEQERRIAQILVNRKIRDAAFRRQVIDAYDGTCAVTGIRLINGGGKAEAQAAHIWPVADGGPDVVQNGIALSATVHWLFDRHLIALTDDYALLVARNRLPRELQSLFARQMDWIILLREASSHPHLSYIQRHRERFAAA